MGFSLLWLAAWTLIYPSTNANYGSERVHIDPTESSHDSEFFDFVTRPDIVAPKWNVQLYDKDALSPGYWFVSPYEIIVQKHDYNRSWVGPHIYDGNGELVWSGTPDLNGWLLNDFRVSNVNGEDMLTGINPKHSAGVIINNRYELDREIRVRKNGRGPNRHDFHTTDNGTRALAMTWYAGQATREDLQSIGKEGKCRLSREGFQEFDLKTGKKVFDWSSEGHILPNESYTRPICRSHHGWDYLHPNSIDKLPDGDYLLSGRLTDTIYKISGKDGSILWRLGGKQSDFEIDGHWSGQHAVRIMSANATHIMLAMMDNAMRPGKHHITNSRSRGMTVEVRTDTHPMRAKVLQTYGHPLGNEHSPGRGNLEILANGNTFAGWWNNSGLSETDSNGRLLMEAWLRCELRSYRSYKFPWVGHPQRAPDVYSMAIATNNHGRTHKNVMGVLSDVTTHVYVSWNGATEVAYWSLYRADESGNATDVLASASRTGFETKITYRGYSNHVVVKAFDKYDVILGESLVVETIWPTNVHVVQTIAPTNAHLTETVPPTATHTVETISPTTSDIVKTTSTTATTPTGTSIENEHGLEPSGDSLQTKLQDMLQNPATTYVLVIVPWISLVVVSFVLGFLRARAGYTRWWWMSQSRNNQQYEAVEQGDFEEEQDASELEEKDIDDSELLGRRLRSDAG